MTSDANRPALHGAAETTGSVSFTSQLSKNYRAATPTPPTPDSASLGSLAVVEFPGNPCSLLSVGSDQHLYLISPAPDNDTGWMITDLFSSLVPVPVVYVACGRVSANGMSNLTICYLGTDGSINQLVVALPSWKALGPPVSTRVDGVTMQGLSTGSYNNGESYFVMKDSGSTQIYILYGGPTLSLVQLFPASSEYVVSGWCAATDSSSSGLLTGGLICYQAQSSDELLSGMLDNGGQPAAGPRMNLSDSFGPLASASNASGQLCLCGISWTDNYLYYFDFAQGTTANLNGDTTPFANLVAGTDRQGRFELFATAVGGQLYHLRQDPASASGWSSIIPLDPRVKFAQIGLGKNPAGYSDVFGVTTRGDLYHVWEENDGTWHLDLLSFPASGPKAIEEFDSYTVQLTAFDANGVIAPSAGVTISSPHPVIALVNGESVTLGPRAPWQGTCNGAGQATIVIETLSLGTPLLSVTTSLMAGTWFSVEPSGPVRATLAGLQTDGSTLRDAYVTDSDGKTTPLLKDKRAQEHAAAVSEAVVRSMQITNANNVNPRPGASALHRWSDPVVAWHDVSKSAGRRQLDVPSIPYQAWEVDFSSGGVDFRTLTTDEAERRYHQLDSLTPLGSIWGHLKDLWGDVCDAVREGGAEIVHILVRADKVIEGAVRTTIKMVIDDVKYVFDAVIDSAQRAINLAEMVFDRVSVEFRDLVGWLGYIFNWNDIRLAHKAVAHGIRVSFDLLEEGIKTLKTEVDSGIENLESWVKSQFKTVIAKFDPNDTLGQYQAANEVPSPAAMSLASANFLSNGIINAASSGGAATGHLDLPALDTTTQEVIDRVMSKIEEYAKKFHNAEPFQHAVAYFEQIGSQPSSILQLGMSGLLSFLEGCILSFLDGLDVLIDVVLDAMDAIVRAARSALDATLQVPFVSDFYTYITRGGKPSILDVMALLTAIPATAFYKLVLPNAGAPFQSEADVEAFRSATSAAAILSGMGLTSSEAPRPAGDAPFAFLNFCTAVNSTNQFIYGLMDAVVDIQPIENSPLPTWFSFATFACELSGSFTGIPGVVGNGQAASCNAGGVSNWLWGDELIFNFIDVIWILGSGHMPRGANDWGVAWDTGAGISQLVLVILRSTKGEITTAQIAGSVIGVIPEVSKPLRFSKVIKQSKEVSVLALAGIDLLFDTTASFIQLFTIGDGAAPASRAGTGLGAATTRSLALSLA
jgi:hypothetical protein